MEEGGRLRSRRARGVRLRRHDAVGRRTREGERRGDRAKQRSASWRREVRGRDREGEVTVGERVRFRCGL